MYFYGKFYFDVVRFFWCDVFNLFDVVVYFVDENDVVELFDWVDFVGVVVIFFGGGISVVGGVEFVIVDFYVGSISFDFGKFD